MTSPPVDYTYPWDVAVVIRQHLRGPDKHVRTSFQSSFSFFIGAIQFLKCSISISGTLALGLMIRHANLTQTLPSLVKKMNRLNIIARDSILLTVMLKPHCCSMSLKVVYCVPCYVVHSWKKSEHLKAPVNVSIIAPPGWTVHSGWAQG